MVPTSQHIGGDEPLEGLDLELDRVGEGGGGEEQRGGHLHGGDQRHSAWNTEDLIISSSFFFFYVTEWMLQSTKNKHNALNRKHVMKRE